MWWNILIIPNGYRYKVRLGEGNFDVLADEYKEIDFRAKIRFLFKYYLHPNNLDWKNGELLIKEVNLAKKEFAEKYKTTLVPNQILNLIKSTEPDHLDIIVELDVDTDNDFSMTYRSDEIGALDILYSAKNYILVNSSLKEIKQKLMDDYRFRKLSKDGQAIALDRAEDESKMRDSIKINEWIERLKNAIDIKNKRKKPSTKVWASIFDGLK